MKKRYSAPKTDIYKNISEDVMLNVSWNTPDIGEEDDVVIFE